MKPLPAWPKPGTMADTRTARLEYQIAKLTADRDALLQALKTVMVPLQIQFDLHQRMCEQQGVDITESKAYKTAKERLDIANEAIKQAETGATGR